jgi:hypothetical protein
MERVVIHAWWIEAVFQLHESYMKKRSAAQYPERALQHSPGTSIQLESQPVLNR